MPKPRQIQKRNNIQKFSSFYQVDKPVPRWVCDRQLERNINRLMQQHPEKNESDWVLYFIDAAKNGTDPLAKQHLCAYLEEACFWAAKKVFLLPGFTHLDYWQIAREKANDPLRIFKNGCFQNHHPSNYAKKILRGNILDVIRQGQETKRASDWGLLKNLLSKKRLKEALHNAGMKEPKLSGYVLAWQAFNAVYAPPANLRKNQLLPAPTDRQFSDMAAYYNEQNEPCKSSNAGVSGKDIQKMLKTCIQVVRQNEEFKVTSLDAIENKDKTEFNSVDGDNDNPTLADEVFDRPIVKPENWEEMRLQEITKALAGAIASLPATDRTILILAYGLTGLNQTQIGKQFGIPQYKVSRSLDRYHRSLLKTLATWKQAQSGSAVNVAQINQFSDELKLCLSSYCQERILYRFLQTNLRLHPKLQPEIPLLSRYYGQNLPVADILNQFELTESQFEGKINNVQQILHGQFNKFCEQTLNLKPSFHPVAAKPLANLIETGLKATPYAILKMERRQ
jgi:RNA polymerase sigma factor (sigma-70 family)